MQLVVSRTRWGKNVARMTDKKEAHKLLTAIPKEKKPHGGNNRRWCVVLIYILQKLGYDLQISTVKHRLMASHFKQCNAYLFVQNKRKIYPNFTINYVVTRIYKALHRKRESCGLDSR
jgi:hypothetical protein